MKLPTPADTSYWSEALGRSTQLGVNLIPYYLVSHGMNALERVSPRPHFFGGLYSPIRA